MFINKDSIQIKINNNYVSLGSYITDAKFGYHKLWADPGRNLSGKMTSTFIGIFPKITINFGRLSKSVLETLIPVFNAPRQTIKYYDAEKQTTVEMTTYTNDLEIENKRIIGIHTNEPFSLAFISVERRR